MIIRGTTKIIGLAGKNISHSLSPIIHNYLISHYKLDALYVVFDFKKNFHNFYNFLKTTNNFLGCNVTIPFKEDAYKLADKIICNIKNIGAVNTLKLVENKVLAYNTDIDGILHTFKNVLNFDFKNKNIIIFGSGGTCKTLVQILKNHVSGITIVSRNKKNIENMLSEKVKWKEFKNNINCLTFYDADMIINATPLGINGELININWDILKKDIAIFDLIYLETPLILNAKKRNLNCVNGKYMLIYQAIKSFEIWTDIVITDSMINNIKKEVFNEK